MEFGNENVKVSVIVPVYNSEKYLTQCMDSIVGQSLKEIEIICVDDGSTDSSPQILKQYQEQDERIRIFRQENQYAGAARNLGMSHASGEYLIFWDSDDFFVANALELMYQRISEVGADICVCGANQYLENKGQSYPYNGYMNKDRIPEGDWFNRESNEDYILNFTNEAVWNKLYRAKFVTEHGLQFPNFRVGEDAFFSVISLCLAEKITTISKPLMNYRRNNPGSLVGTSSLKPLEPFKAWVAIAEFLDERQLMPEKSFVNRAVGTIQTLLRRLQTEDAFLEAVSYLQGDNLQKLHFKGREAGYYYHPGYAEFVSHILEDSPREFRDFLTYSTYIELTEKVAEIRKLKKENTKNKKKRIELEEKNAETVAELKELQQRLEKKQKDLQKVEKRMDEAEKQLDEERRKAQQIRNELEVRRKEADRIRNSTSYKVGRIILWLPIKIKKIFTKKK